MKRLMDSNKMLWHMDRVIDYYDKGIKVPPILINMGATKKCNANCVYCYGEFQGKDQRSTIAKKPLFNLFEQAPRIGVKAMEIIGDGEPTLNPHIYDAMDIGKEGGLDMSFSTNGILLDDDRKREAILRNCEWMRFNLSAGTPTGYKKIHRVDKFDKVVENIEALVDMKQKRGYKCDVGLQAVYVPKLMDEEMIKESELAQKLGVDYFLIKQCSLPEKDSSVGAVSFDVSDYRSSRTRDVLKQCESFSSDKTDVVVKWNYMDMERERPYEHCVDIPLIFQISGNGKCYPCGFLFGNDKYLYGDLNDTPIEEIVGSDRYWKIVDDMVNNFDVNKDCTGCCRHDGINRFISEYLDKPNAVNFI